MVILGLDPGLASMGWAVLEGSTARPACLAAGVIRTKRSEALNRCDDNVKRLAVIAYELNKLHQAHDFVFVAAEAQSWTRFANADRSVAMVWGVIAALAELCDAPVIQLRPQEIKAELAGAMSASKEAVQAVVEDEIAGARAALALIPKTQQNHASDALAAALACRRHPLVQMVRKIRG